MNKTNFIKYINLIPNIESKIKQDIIKNFEIAVDCERLNIWSKTIKKEHSDFDILHDENMKLEEQIYILTKYKKECINQEP